MHLPAPGEDQAHRIAIRQPDAAVVSGGSGVALALSGFPRRRPGAAHRRRRADVAVAALAGCRQWAARGRRAASTALARNRSSSSAVAVLHARCACRHSRGATLDDACRSAVCWEWCA